MTNGSDEIHSRRPSVPDRSRAGTEPITVLHVEDDRSFREFLAESLPEERERISVVSEADAETGVLLEVNPAAAELLGRPAEEGVGLPYTDLLPEGKEHRYRELFSDPFLTDGSVASRFPDGSPIGSSRWESRPRKTEPVSASLSSTGSPRHTAGRYA